jgi:hypothetical protein
MSRTFIGVCLVSVLTLLAVPARSARADELIDRLQAIPGLTIVQEKPTTTGGRFFVMTYEQPVNHLKPWKGTFTQRVSLYHKGDDRPMVFYSSGYNGSTVPSLTELTQIVDGNQLNVEHRFFPPSRPLPADWEDLTIFQQATDDHRIVMAFRDLYPARWLRTGVSKGGMQATYHRRFYPQDIDGLVAYVAPNDVIDSHDAYAAFLDHVGNDPQCRENLKAVQRNALLHRDEIVPMMIADAELFGYSYEQVFGTPDKALELLVLEMPFTFWQYGSQALCATVPPATDAYPQDLYFFLDAVQVFQLWSDDFMLRLTPYYYQAGTQLGYPTVADAHLAGLLHYPGADVPRSFVPAEIDMPPFQWWAMADIDFSVRFGGRRQMFIYGELDPWGAERFQPGPFSPDSYTYTIPGGNHLSKISQLPAAQRGAAIATVRRWAGLPPLALAELTTLEERGKEEPTLDLIDRMQRRPR